jgi:hypothetical protein
MAAQPIPPGAAEARIEKLGLETLCDRLVSGETQTAICKSIGVTKGSLRRWISLDAERQARVNEARIAAASAYEELAFELLKASKNAFDLSVNRELAHHLRWQASKADPRRYGEKLQVDQQTTIISLSDEEIARRAADIRAKLEAQAQPVDGTASQ